MKIFKYVIFLSILSGIFFFIYRQSDQKGFKRWWISFKVAAITAAIGAGFIPLNTKAIESPGNNNSNQQVILAKADGNPVNPPTNRGPSNFPTPPAGSRPSRPVYVPKHRTAPKFVDQGLGAGGNPAGAGGGGGAGGFDDNQCPVPEKGNQQSKASEYDYRSNASKKKKKSKDQDQEQCPINQQNKAGIDELPDSSSGKYVYQIDTNAAKKELENVWKDPEAKKETLSKLEKIEKGELTNRNQKSLKGFQNLKEYKFNKIRIIVQRGQQGAPEQIVGIVKRSRLDDLMKTFKDKFQ